MFFFEASFFFHIDNCQFDVCSMNPGFVGIRQIYLKKTFFRTRIFAKILKSLALQMANITMYKYRYIIPCNWDAPYLDIHSKELNLAAREMYATMAIFKHLQSRNPNILHNCVQFYDKDYIAGISSSNLKSPKVEMASIKFEIASTAVECRKLVQKIHS